jgi:hypothetical protein
MPPSHVLFFDFFEKKKKKEICWGVAKWHFGKKKIKKGQSS